MLVLLVRHFLKLFLYSDKADRDILGRYSYYGSNLIVAHVLEPEKYYSPVKKPQLAYTALKQLYLSAILACVIEKVDVHLKWHCLSSAFLLAFRRDASVQADTVNPCAVATLPTKLLKAIPWIVSKRQKTGVPFQIKLMDIPMQIIKRYEPYRISNTLFNIGSHDTINKRIKEVAKMCGIVKRTSFHLSRHTFAVSALNYGMPIESVSKILGHTNITTTQIYAKVTNTKLEHDISMFESRVSERFAI